MANRSFFMITLFATLIGIGMAGAVRPSMNRDIQNPRTSLIGLCLNSGIGCGVVTSRQAGTSF